MENVDVIANDFLKKVDVHYEAMHTGKQIWKVNSTYEALGDPKENVGKWGSAQMFSFSCVFSELSFIWRWNLRYKYKKIYKYYKQPE